jgi:hypothetical protein
MGYLPVSPVEYPVFKLFRFLGKERESWASGDEGKKRM